MIYDPGLRTVVGIDMPMSDSVFCTSPSTCNGGSICSGLSTVG